MHDEKTSFRNKIYSGTNVIQASQQCTKPGDEHVATPIGRPAGEHVTTPIGTNERDASTPIGTKGSDASTPSGTKVSDAFSFDVIVIGAGAVGCATARELSGKGLSVAVLEKEADVAFGSSGRNSGVVHAGFNNRPGSLMAKLCVQGCENFEKEAGRLGVPFRRTGKYVLAFSDKDIATLDMLLENGTKNGVKGLEIIRGQQLQKIFPDLVDPSDVGNGSGIGSGTGSGVSSDTGSGVGSDSYPGFPEADLSTPDFHQIKAALWSPMTGIFDPFRYNIALAEDAKKDGADFFFLHEVESINRIENKKESASAQMSTYFHIGQIGANSHVEQADTDYHTQQVNTDFHIGQAHTNFHTGQAHTNFHTGQAHTGFLVKTNCGGHQYDFRCRFLINSAGLSSDAVCRMLGIFDYRISPCRGEYHVLSKDVCKTTSDDQHIRIPQDRFFSLYHQSFDVPLYPAPNFSEGGLGVHLTPTIDGNIMIGPGSEYLDYSGQSDMIDKSKDFSESGETSQYSNDSGENYATTKKMMDLLLDEGLKLLSLVSGPRSSGSDETSSTTVPYGDKEDATKIVPSTNYKDDAKKVFFDNIKTITKDDIIKSFSGIRPKLTSKEKGGFADFVIENKDGFIILTGIESPGLTASIPIAKMVSAMLDDLEAGSGSGSDSASSTEKNDFESSEIEYSGFLQTQEMSERAETSLLNSKEDNKACISGEHGSERIICSCEKKTEADILKAYDSIISLGAVVTFKGLKNRTRIGMGNCQGSFCLVNTIELLQKKRGIDPLTFDNLFSGRVR